MVHVSLYTLFIELVLYTLFIELVLYTLFIEPVLYTLFIELVLYTLFIEPVLYTLFIELVLYTLFIEPVLYTLFIELVLYTLFIEPVLYTLFIELVLYTLFIELVLFNIRIFCFQLFEKKLNIEFYISTCKLNICWKNEDPYHRNNFKQKAFFGSDLAAISIIKQALKFAFEIKYTQQKFRIAEKNIVKIINEYCEIIMIIVKS